MNHIAIMNSKIASIDDILSGKKTIESRWSKNKSAPWGKVHAGDTVYFKNSGGLVIVRATVSKVLQFDNLSPDRVREILEKWGGADGIAVTNLENTIQWARNKKYCVLMWLKNSRKVKSFKINKSGFGSAAAWLSNFKIPSRCE